MKFDFTTIMDRKGKDALAVDKIPYKDVTVQGGFFYHPDVGGRYEFCHGAVGTEGDDRSYRTSGIRIF